MPTYLMRGPLCIERFLIELGFASFLQPPHFLANLKSATTCHPFSYTSSCSGMYCQCPCEEDLSVY